jgi:hypothetical protein
MDSARHVIGCNLTQETRIHYSYAFDDVGSTMLQSLVHGDTMVVRCRLTLSYLVHELNATRLINLGRCGLTVSKPVLKAPVVSALETIV